MGLGDIEKLADCFNESATRLEEGIAALEADLEKVKQKYLGSLKKMAGIVAGCEAELRAAVEANPGLFEKPRTIVAHGIKFGFSVSEGRLVFDDADTVVALIKRWRPEDLGTLIRTKEEPDKDALKALDVAELKKIGCRIEGAGDQVLVKRTAGEVEALINKLIKKLVEAMSEN